MKKSKNREAASGLLEADLEAADELSAGAEFSAYSNNKPQTFARTLRADSIEVESSIISTPSCGRPDKPATIRQRLL